MLCVDMKTMMSIRDLFQENERPVHSLEIRPSRFSLVAIGVFICFGAGLSAQTPGSQLSDANQS